MLEHQIPEMQRVPLEELCLQIKAVLSPNTVSLSASYVKALVVLMRERDVYRECSLHWSVVSRFMKCYM